MDSCLRSVSHLGLLKLTSRWVLEVGSGWGLSLGLRETLRISLPIHDAPATSAGPLFSWYLSTHLSAQSLHGPAQEKGHTDTLSYAHVLT